MEEYIVKHKAGNSSYWYINSLYAYSEEEARKEAEIYIFPYNVKETMIIKKGEKK